MEDERRPLPDGWVRQYDSQNDHQFFVDTRSKTPRSIWHHPYDDDEYLSTLPSAERERIQELSRQPSLHDVIAMSSDEEDEAYHGKKAMPESKGAMPATGAAAGASSSGQQPPHGDHLNAAQKWGRKMKDKATSSTHEQRQQERRKREQEETNAYEAHIAFRRALQKSIETGQPQYVGKDRDGKSVYIEPPNGAGPGYGYGGNGGYGVNPYNSGAYQNPNARFIRPQAQYSRPYGYGYGGGYGLPLMGGLAGGMMLGGMMGGMGGMGGFGM